MTDPNAGLGRPAVGFAFFGDGGSSTGDIHETLNLAPPPPPIILVIENNRYAYSTPVGGAVRPRHRALAPRRPGYGIEGFAPGRCQHTAPPPPKRSPPPSTRSAPPRARF